MKRSMAVAVVLLAVLATSSVAARDVGLGVTFGTVFPKTERAEFGDVGFGWGFWVDIPVAWKFHITPSTELYNIGGKVDENPATDLCLNFKFILPVGPTRIFFGPSTGVTVNDSYYANAGLLAGFSFPLLADLEAFISAKYNVVIGDPNLHVIHSNVGLLFLF